MSNGQSVIIIAAPEEVNLWPEFEEHEKLDLTVESDEFREYFRMVREGGICDDLTDHDVKQALDIFCSNFLAQRTQYKLVAALDGPGEDVRYVITGEFLTEIPGYNVSWRISEDNEVELNPRNKGYEVQIAPGEFNKHFPWYADLREDDNPAFVPMGGESLKAKYKEVSSAVDYHVFGSPCPEETEVGYVHNDVIFLADPDVCRVIDGCLSSTPTMFLEDVQPYQAGEIRELFLNVRSGVFEECHVLELADWK